MRIYTNNEVKVKLMCKAYFAKEAAKEEARQLEQERIQEEYEKHMCEKLRLKLESVISNAPLHK